MYLFSDGYEDQNNSEQKRFGTKKLIEILNNNARLDSPVQKQAIDNKMITWQGKEKQRDAILVVGLKFGGL